MNIKKNLARNTSLVLCASLLFCGATQAAYATGNTVVNEEAHSLVVEYDDTTRLARDIEVLFTRYVVLDVHGNFVVNVPNIQADGYSSGLDDFIRLAAVLNSTSEKIAVSSTGVSPTDLGSFAVCVVEDGLGLKALKNAPQLLSVIKEGVRAWNWGLTASSVARIIGPGFVRALGGPWGLAVQLGWSAWNCRGHL